MDKLLLCPFCGSEPRYVRRKYTDSQHAVGCSSDECIIWLPKDVKLRQLHNYAGVYVIYDDMKEAWNTRIKP